MLPIDIYSWNMNLLPAEVSSLKKQAEKYSCGLFSYDEAFCERNGFKFNTIMFDERCKCPRVQRKSDVVFLGYSKDRSGTVANAADLLSSAGLKLDFTVVGSAPYGVKNANITYVEGYIPYREYLKRVFGSRAIVDIAQQGRLAIPCESWSPSSTIGNSSPRTPMLQMLRFLNTATFLFWMPAPLRPKCRSSWPGRTCLTAMK